MVAEQALRRQRPRRLVSELGKREFGCRSVFQTGLWEFLTIRDPPFVALKDVLMGVLPKK